MKGLAGSSWFLVSLFRTSGVLTAADNTRISPFPARRRLTASKIPLCCREPSMIFVTLSARKRCPISRLQRSERRI
ncbi:hypothetical protein BDV98DRAFT_577242 [Pterulicium gracile]|uniref:Secreted protein n=1 Tax=Pterulicium gracile TaxID=1884261 RepID=A0A5C3Q0X4_9AGAR|nr:hypothetical protein BDV98DRAFT_577242 [Pterula gracilis]